jgi:hypothetical protein
MLNIKLSYTEASEVSKGFQDIFIFTGNNIGHMAASET